MDDGKKNGTKAGLGLSPLTGRVYWGRSNGLNWVGEKRDITSEFVQIVLQKFGPDTPDQKGVRSEITVDGVPTFEIIVKRIENKPDAILAELAKTEVGG